MSLYSSVARNMERLCFLDMYSLRGANGPLHPTETPAREWPKMGRLEPDDCRPGNDRSRRKGVIEHAVGDGRCLPKNGLSTRLGYISGPAQALGGAEANS